MTQSLKAHVFPVHDGVPPHPVRRIEAGSRAARNDPRWPQIAATLAALHERGRRSVRIVDVDCACGTLLLEAARHARALGFTAIEGRGVDNSPSLIGKARAAAARSPDPAVGLSFDLADMTRALAEEAGFPADMILWHGNRPDDRRSGIADALAAAGNLVIGDPVAALARQRAA